MRRAQDPTPPLSAVLGEHRGRWIVEADPDVPWREVTWIPGLMSRSPEGTRRLTLLNTARGERIDVDLAGEIAPSREDAPDAREGVVVAVALFRKDKNGPNAWTRLRVRSRTASVVLERTGAQWSRPVSFPGPRHGGPIAQSEPSAASRTREDQVAFDLRPPGEEDAWRRAEEEIRARADGADVVVGELSAPPPDGPAVPFGHVHRALRLLRDAGATAIRLEGASAPPPEPLTDSPPR
jgi:hypothetical protein